MVSTSKSASLCKPTLLNNDRPITAASGRNMALAKRRLKLEIQTHRLIDANTDSPDNDTPVTTAADIGSRVSEGAKCEGVNHAKLVCQIDISSKSSSKSESAQ